jgi:arsenate reductase
MAEAYLKKFGKDQFIAESAGLEPGTLNPLAIAVMKEDGLDISKNLTKDVFSLSKNEKEFDYVVTVCDKEASDRCPVFPGLNKKINWSFEDPSNFNGSYEEKLAATRIIRDQIKHAVLEFINSNV